MSDWAWIFTGAGVGLVVGAVLAFRYLEDWVSAVMFGVIGALLGLLLVGLTVSIVDEATEPVAGTVTGREYLPESTTTVCHLVGKVLVCNPIHTPECYELVYVDRDGNEGDDCVSPEEFEAASVGSWHEGDGN